MDSAKTGRTIDREELLSRLKRAGAIKQHLTLASMLAYGVAWLVFASPMQDPVMFMIGLAVVGVIVNLVVRFTICARMSRCPHCAASLWRCAHHGYGRTGSTVLKPYVKQCPSCAAVFE